MENHISFKASQFHSHTWKKMDVYTVITAAIKEEIKKSIFD